jgi:DNA-binding NtrC family response regulator
MAKNDMKSSTSEVHVLVADGDPSLLDLMTRRLVKMGITPDRASDGAEAQALVEQNDYDVIVTDIYMPEVTSLELLRIAKERDLNVQVVVGTTATVENAVDALGNSAFGYLTRPFDHLNAFNTTVTRAMEFRPLLLDNQRIAEVQKRRGDTLEEEGTKPIRQLHDRGRGARQRPAVSERKGVFRRTSGYGRRISQEVILDWVSTRRAAFGRRVRSTAKIRWR